jgi:GT2 family glycosyltransferase
MDVSIIIPSLNSRTVSGVVDALSAQTCAEVIQEILVVGLDELGLIRDDPRVRFHSTGKPVCAAAARNWGLHLAQSDLLIVLDSDCFPATDWLARLLDCYAQGERVVSGSIAFEEANYWTLVDNLSLFHEFMPDQAAGVRRFLPTANLLFDHRVIEASGEMDESFPGAAGEDVDWTLRMRQAGFRLYFEPVAQVIHRPARAAPRDVLRHFWRSGRNMGRVRWQYRDEFKTPRAGGHPFWLVALSPVVGLWATLRMFGGDRYLLRYLHTAPAIWLTKVVWCLGAASGIRTTTTSV